MSDKFKEIQKQLDKLKAQHQSTCPNCGHCPTCGRTPYRAYPYYPQPWYPTTPYWYYGTTSGAIQAPTITTGGGTIGYSSAKVEFLASDNVLRTWTDPTS